MGLSAVFLDYNSLDRGDLDVAVLKQQLDALYLYPASEDDQIVLRLKDADVAIVNKVRLTQSIIQQLPKLKLILISATGTNNVDLDAASARNIPVLNCQAYGTHAVAQHTLGLILALATNLIAYHGAVQQGLWQQSKQFCLLDYPIIELAGKTLGILGYGELGQAVAKLAQAFGMQVLIGQIPNRPIRADSVALDELLRRADVLSLHCPLTEETKNLIDQRALALMKPSAFLINTARGGIVDEQALHQALSTKQIAAAAMDVLSEEPPLHGNILLEKPLPNLIISPHCAWGSVQARQNIMNQVAENIQAFRQNSLLRCVNGLILD